MRRRHVLAMIIIVIGGYILAWHLQPTREIAMLVVDKTVPETDFREHRAIFWVARHRRFTGPEGDFYRFDRDYLGYHPETGVKEELKAADLAGVDLLYLADSYGIYDYEEGLQVYEEKLPHEHQDIELIYGGFNLDEAEVVARFAAEEGNILIGEHNIFGYPTYLDPEAARILQDLFNVGYDGWLARYYHDLDQVAFWLKELYSRIYGIPWDLDGAGMVFVREEVPDLDWYPDLVVIERKDFTGPWPVIETSSRAPVQGAASGVPYLYWMEVLRVEENEHTEVLAYYRLPVHEEARVPLAARGLPERFPAAVRYYPPGEAERFYFGGDFADQLPALLPPGLTGSAAIQRFLTFIPGLPEEYRFYFQWYEPVLTRILSSAEKGTDHDR